VHTLLDGPLPGQALDFLGRVDPALEPWFPRIGPIVLTPQRPAFRSLCRAIIAQQVSNKAAATMIERCFALCTRPGHPTPADLLRLTDDQLQAAGISRQKRTYLRALAQAFDSGHLRNVRFAGRSEPWITEALVKVTGIGQWTAEMFLLFSLGRPDVFSGGDLALRAGICRIDGRESITPAEAIRRAEVWSPWRSVASLYLWRISHWKEPVE
jgi:DNA-3-methyladenine glycosylase II